jgi:hypothetical protein
MIFPFGLFLGFCSVRLSIQSGRILIGLDPFGVGSAAFLKVLAWEHSLADEQE